MGHKTWQLINSLSFLLLTLHLHTGDKPYKVSRKQETISILEMNLTTVQESISALKINTMNNLFGQTNVKHPQKSMLA